MKPNRASNTTERYMNLSPDDTNLLKLTLTQNGHRNEQLTENADGSAAVTIRQEYLDAKALLDSAPRKWRSASGSQGPGYSCAPCSVAYEVDLCFATKRMLMEHNRLVHGPKHFCCNFPGCGQALADRHQRKEHVRSVHLSGLVSYVSNGEYVKGVRDGRYVLKAGVLGRINADGNGWHLLTAYEGEIWQGLKE